MPFINEKLGNGFVINPADSSRSEEHYFSGGKKHLNMTAVGVLTGSNLRTLTTGSNLGNGAFSWDFRNIVSDNHGGLYASGMRVPLSGQVTPSYGGSEWVVLYSPDSGESWTEADTLTGSTSRAVDMVADSNGTVFVAGIHFGLYLIRSGSINIGFTTTTTRSTTQGSLVGIKGAVLAINPDDEDQMYFQYMDSSANFDIISSSDGGTSWSPVSGTPGFINDAPQPTSMLIRNGKIFTAYQDIVQSPGGEDLIKSGTAGGSLQSTAVNQRTMISGMDGYISPATNSVEGRRFLNKMFVDSSGTFWAVGCQFVVTSSGDFETGTWGHHVGLEALMSDIRNSFDSSDSLHITDIKEDGAGYLWMSGHNAIITSATTSPQSFLLYCSASLAADASNWNLLTFDAYKIRGLTVDDKYKNLVVIGYSGSYQISEFGIIDKKYTESLINQGSSSFNVSGRPTQHLFGLRFVDSITSSSLSKNERGAYLLGLGGGQDPYRVEEIKDSSLINLNFNFKFSGSYDSIVETSVAPKLTIEERKPFNDIREDAIVQVLSDNSSSFNIEAKKLKQTLSGSIAFVRVSVSASGDFALDFENFRVRYDQPLTNDGVRFFKNVENQQLEFENINVNIMPGVDD